MVNGIEVDNISDNKAIMFWQDAWKNIDEVGERYIRCKRRIDSIKTHHSMHKSIFYVLPHIPT